MSKEIKTDKINIDKLFTDFWFIVPEYQRPYVWQEDQVKTLLDDLWEHYQRNINKRTKDEYFLGSLVLQQDAESGLYNVLDGQQRLTTLLLILAMLRNYTNDIDNCEQYIKQAASKIKRIDKERNRIEFKIRDNIEEFTTNYIYKQIPVTELEDKFKNINKNSKNISVKNLTVALITIKNFFDNIPPKALEDFLTMILQDVILIYIATESRQDAFRLFTILNSRGVQLTSADILKSINLEKVENPKEREKYAQMWEKIQNSFDDDGFDRFLSHLRAILVKQKARGTLLNEFEKIIYNNKEPLMQIGKETFDYIKTYKNIYDKIILLADTDEIGFKSELSVKFKNFVTILRAAFSSTDWIPPLLAYYNKFKDEKIFEFLQKMEEKALCDQICRLSTTMRMNAFYRIIETIERAKTPKEVLEDDSLVNSNKNYAIRILYEEGIYGRIFDKYILLKYEYLHFDEIAEISDYSNLSIEHVLPQYPGDDSQWVKDFTEEEREKWTHNLANLILISGRKNSALSNLNFADKKLKLQSKIKDIFKGSLEVMTGNEWTPKTLEIRQKNMIEILFE